MCSYAINSITNNWILFPICNNKIRIRIREDTEATNFSLYCPKCKKESLINIDKLEIVMTRESEAQIQE
ncbi:MAG: cysteine-rich KTR domain-containing protein [Lachnospiraceae bacterium]